MQPTTKITILAENTASQRGLLAEHGLAFWIEASGQRLLFDTGQGLVLTHNAAALGIDLRTAAAVVLSHGHYDHSGGLAEVLANATEEVTVYAHPKAWLPRYHRNSSGVRSVGVSASAAEVQRNRGASCRAVTAVTEILPGVTVTGEIPRRHPEEATDEGFCLDAEGRQPDTIVDDLALCLRTPTGTIVLLGCAHAGVINTLDHVMELTGGEPLRAVLGGMHLRSAPPERIAWTTAALRRFRIPVLCPMHCTGMPATAALWSAFPGPCVAGPVGTTWTF
jgi:7,8-dihydropterin-6-yl-methyl-4-(beta-D-ribofuranosyl)aminobenzene 5'-phosphate synthase